VSTDLGLLFQVKNADDIAQFVRHALTRGQALWGVDFAVDTKAVRYPLVIYLYNAAWANQSKPGVQAYGSVSRVAGGATPTSAPHPDLVPQHLRKETHRTWFYFDQILNVNPSVPHREFYTVNGQRVESVFPDVPVILGPPYPVKHPKV
jgi:hypothetical protein